MKPSTILAFLLTLTGTAVLVGCNPTPGSGTIVRGDVGIRDYFTMRSVDGTLETRDLLPEPRPREAITGDDYFQVKLEHIYIGDALGREVGNLAVIAQIDGLIPKGMACSELDVAEFGFDLDQRERSTHASSAQCAFKHVVAVNPVFAQGHVTFDSAFITPPFRMGRKEIGLRFIIAQLNDVELAQMLVKWSQEQLNNLSDWGFEELALTRWQTKLIDIGFTVANYILDYAAKPDYVFEFETDFVPIETVGGVTTPQNLFMGGDFVIVGFPEVPADTLASADEAGAARAMDRSGALVMSEKLIFDSGRLYWKSSRKEFRDAPYVVFKVVRESRFAAELPVTLAALDREITRGAEPAEVMSKARSIVLDMQDDSVLNETEGRYLLDLFEWFAEARNIESQLEALANAPGVADLEALSSLAQAQTQMTRLRTRIYDPYTRSPGMWQAECTTIRDVTRDIAQLYGELSPDILEAYGQLSVERNALQTKAKRSAAEEERLLALTDAESRANRLTRDLGATLEIPPCPALRE